MDKKELRKIIKDRMRQYSSRQLEELSLSVLSRLDSNPHLQNAQTILMYYSLPDEVDTHHYIDQLVSRGKRVILPVVLDDTNMALREYSGVPSLLRVNVISRFPDGEVSFVSYLSVPVSEQAAATKATSARSIVFVFIRSSFGFSLCFFCCAGFAAKGVPNYR